MGEPKELTKDVMEKITIDQLVSIFKNRTPEEVRSVVNKVLARLNNDSKHNALERLLDSQIKKLEDLRTPKQIVESLQVQKYFSVISKASEIWNQKYSAESLEDLERKGIYLAIPVILRSFRTDYDLMSMIRVNDKIGRACIDSTSALDTVKISTIDTYIHDIEDGTSTLGMSPNEAEEIIKQQNRSPLTAAEIIALAVHTDVLSRHNVCALGSRHCSSSDELLYVYLYCSDSQPLLGWIDVGYPVKNMGSPSCGSR